MSLASRPINVLSLDEADVIVTLQADIWAFTQGDALEVQHSFAKSARPDAKAKMNRLYVVEGGYTSTGAAADTRLALAA